MFGQQRDERKASRTRPNYDLFFFEVQTRPSASLKTGSGVKMLYEMQAPALLSPYRPRCQQQMAGMVDAVALRLG
jgi:hypothetical protein